MEKEDLFEATVSFHDSGVNGPGSAVMLRESTTEVVREDLHGQFHEKLKELGAAWEDCDVEDFTAVAQVHLLAKEAAALSEALRALAYLPDEDEGDG